MPATTSEIISTVRIDAPIDEVWSAVTTPERITHWFFGVDTEADWRVGGSLVHHGEYQGDYPTAAPGGSAGVIHGEYKGDYPAPGDSTGPVVVSTPRTTAPGGLGSPSTFDWGDALAGAGAAFGLMLLAGGSALGMRRRQHPAAA